MKGFVRVPLFKIVCLSSQDFVKGRERGVIRPTGDVLGQWFYVRIGSRALRLIEAAPFRFQYGHRMQLRAVQRRKRQARARTGRRR